MGVKCQQSEADKPKSRAILSRIGIQSRKPFKKTAKEAQEESVKEEIKPAAIVKKKTKKTTEKTTEYNVVHKATRNFEGLKEDNVPTQRVIDGPAAPDRSNEQENVLRKYYTTPAPLRDRTPSLKNTPQRVSNKSEQAPPTFNDSASAKPRADRQYFKPTTNQYI